MTQNTRIQNKFQYYAEDCECQFCLYYKGKSKLRKRGCERKNCCCKDILDDAVAHGLIKRKRGWDT